MSVLTETLRGDLLSRWVQPHRKHHNVIHLREVLDAMKLLAADGVEFDREPVELALWFHDAIYEIGRDDNELRSALLARDSLPLEVAGEVARLVMVTETHTVEPGDVNGAVVSDADLSVLGSDEERYERYEAAVREEYEMVPDDVFDRVRVRILCALLDNPLIFHTEPGRDRWEDAARRNVEGEIWRRSR